MNLKKFIGNRIKQFRNSRGWSQEQLAEMLGTTKQTVSRYESGDRQANQDILFQLSEIFNVSIDDFFPDKNENVLLANQYHYLPTAISAGLPFDVEAITESEKITIPDSVMGKWAGHKDIFVTRIFGQSMNRVMQDGSLIAIKPVLPETLKDGDIVVYNYDNEYAVKRYYDQGDFIVFRPDSDSLEFTDKVIPKSSELDLKIKGKVVLYIVELD